MGEVNEPSVERAIHSKQKVDKKTCMNWKNVYFLCVACDSWCDARGGDSGGDKDGCGNKYR